MREWEEKNCIEQKKNCSLNKESVEIDITKNTPSVSKKKECKDTGWTRNCPMCNKVIHYKTKYIRNRMGKLNCICKKCDNLNKKSTPSDLIRKCPKCEKVLIYKKKWNRDDAERKNHCCSKCSRSRNKNLTRNCPRCDVIISYKDGSKLNRANKEKRVCNACRKKSFIEKMAEKARRCGDRSFFPNYNKVACEYFDWLNKFMGWNGQYATHMGEKNVLTYFVDYYEPKLNIVIEWDEEYHARKKQKKMDEKRQNEIKDFLQCKFYRYNALTGCLNEV